MRKTVAAHVQGTPEALQQDRTPGTPAALVSGRKSVPSPDPKKVPDVSRTNTTSLDPFGANCWHLLQIDFKMISNISKSQRICCNVFQLPTSGLNGIDGFDGGIARIPG